MGSEAPQAREDQFLGCLLGLAIGDALGRPLRGLTAEAIVERYGEVDAFIPSETAKEGAPEDGEISDKTEIALCIVESLTTNEGRIDPENINARLGFLAAGPSRQWMSDATVEGIALGAERDGLAPETFQPEPELAVAVRGAPIGLLHAVGGYDEGILANVAAMVSRLSHGGQAQARWTTIVAKAVAQAARNRTVPAAPGDVPEALAGVISASDSAQSFARAVTAAVAFGGDTDSLGAIGGAIAGARFGASGIPQHLIDGLDARIYLTLAAPWFYRTAVRRAGTVIDLRLVQ